MIKDVPVIHLLTSATSPFFGSVVEKSGIVRLPAQGARSARSMRPAESSVAVSVTCSVSSPKPPQRSSISDVLAVYARIPPIERDGAIRGERVDVQQDPSFR